MFTLSLAPEEEGSKMGRTRGKLKRGKSGKKFIKDRVLRGKIVCNRSSGSIQYGSDGKGGLLGTDRCYIAIKKLDDWRKYPLSEWRGNEDEAVKTDVEDEESSRDSEEIISIHSDGGDVDEVTEFVDQVVLSDDSSSEAGHDGGDKEKEFVGESIFDDSHNEEEVDDRSGRESIFDNSSARDEDGNGESEDIAEALNTPVLDTIMSDDDNSEDSDIVSEGIMSIDFPGVILFSDRDRERYGWRFCGQDLNRMRTEHEGYVMYKLRDVVFFFGGDFTPDYRMRAIPFVISCRVKAPFFHTTLVFSKKLMDEYGWSSFRRWSREWDWRIYAMRNLVEGENPVEIVAVNICRRDGHGRRSDPCWCENQIRAEDDVQDSWFHMTRLTRLAESATSALLRRDDELMQFVTNCCSERSALATAMLTETFVTGSAGVVSEYYEYTSKVRIRG